MSVGTYELLHVEQTKGLTNNLIIWVVRTSSYSLMQPELDETQQSQKHVHTNQRPRREEDNLASYHYCGGGTFLESPPKSS